MSVSGKRTADAMLALRNLLGKSTAKTKDHELCPVGDLIGFWNA